MLVLMMASIAAVAAAPFTTTIRPGLICRPIITGVSRSGDVKLCRTKAEWRRAEGCTGVTRYCARKKGGSFGAQTAFALSEGSRVVCKTLRATGSRLYAQQLCLPVREWERMYVDTRDDMGRLQVKYSVMPPYQGDPREPRSIGD